MPEGGIPAASVNEVVAAATLAASTISYVDAPVPAGVSGAAQRRLA